VRFEEDRLSDEWMPPILMTNVPMSRPACEKLRNKLIGRLDNSSVPELQALIREHCFAYQKQGAAYALLGLGGAFGLIHFKARNFKLHVPGMFAVTSLSCILGSIISLNYYKQKVIEEIGKIKEDTEADSMRDELLRHCSKY
jgi:hypothetical protein